MTGGSASTNHNLAFCSAVRPNHDALPIGRPNVALRGRASGQPVPTQSLGTRALTPKHQIELFSSSDLTVKVRQQSCYRVRCYRSQSANCGLPHDCGQLHHLTTLVTQGLNCRLVQLLGLQ